MAAGTAWDNAEAYVNIYRRHIICPRHWSPVCLRSWTHFNFEGKSVVNAWDRLCSYVPGIYVPGRSAAYENQALLAELWAPATVKKVIALKALAQTIFQRRACFWGTEPCTKPVPVPVPDQTENKNIQVKCRPTPRKPRSCLIRLGIW